MRKTDLMSRPTPESKLNPQIYGEACAWLVELRTGGLGGVSRERFDAWLRQSPEHLKAYLEVSALWEDAALHDPTRNVSAQAHIERARAEDNLVPLTVPQARTDTPSHAPPPAIPARGRKPLLVAVAAPLIAVILAVGYEINAHRGMYTTGVGEERSIALGDGSLIQLNAESRIRVRYRQRTRDVELISGEALFKVIHDPSRPFVVESGSAIIRDLGTVFDVYRKPKDTTVTVIEGRVAVGTSSLALPYSMKPIRRGGLSSDQSPPPATARGNLLKPSGQGAAFGLRAPGFYPGREQIVLTTGEQVTVMPKRVLPPIHVNVANATAWTHRKLVFDSVPLRQVVQSFNRYNARPIVIDDPALENFRIIGVFSSTGPSSLLRFLSAQPGINVVENAREVRITRDSARKAPLR